MAMNKDTLANLIISKQDNMRTNPLNPDYNNWRNALADNDHEEMTRLIYVAMADAVIEHISDAAQIQFRATDLGIQTSTAPGSPTAGPAAPMLLLPGQIS